MAVDLAPKLVLDGKIKNVKEKLTMYSLFKQIEEGDADALGEDEDLIDQSQNEKKAVWLQQKGKSKQDCMKEYIILISNHSQELKNSLEQVLNKNVEEFNYKSENANMAQINKSPGGALAKATSKPKDMHQEENKKFVAGLNKREL